jgi:acetyl-CoA carboxylase carboxyl transferase subunit alpha
VISPEGCAAILWRSAQHRDQAAGALKLTSSDLLRLGVADEVVTEPSGGAHADWDSTAECLKNSLIRNVRELQALDLDRLVRNRSAKFEAMGSWRED